jgi:hypothetical protein
MSGALDEIRQRLRAFADGVAETSPLYGLLAGEAAADDEVAALLTAAPPERADAELLLAAVQRVLQSEPFHELTNYYPALGGSYGPDGGTWPLFRAFALERADRVRSLIATRVPRTNEVGRAALLYPAVALAARQAGGPVGLLEVGTCAGLLLGMDTYSYRYQTEQSGQIVAGPARAVLGLHCALRFDAGQKGPTIPKRLSVSGRVGLDPDPVDLDDEDEYAWLEACVWPDQPDRLRQFGAAATARKKKPPELVAGDPVTGLEPAAARIAEDLPIVVLTSDALRGFDRVPDFLAALDALAAKRPVWWVSLESHEVGLVPDRPDLATGQAVLSCSKWVANHRVTTPLAQTSWHGERMHWL